MDKLYVVCASKSISDTLDEMIKNTVGKEDYFLVKDMKSLENWENKKFIFAAELNNIGYDFEMLELIQSLKNTNQSFKGSLASLLVHSCDELYTKRFSQDLIFLLNSLGCAFIGHPLIEATASLDNFKTWNKVHPESTLLDICLSLCRKQGKRLGKFKKKKKDFSKILLLYSSPNIKSNTLALWNMVREHLIDNKSDFSITEIQIEAGEVMDCKGCLFDLCMHYGERNACFYGGQMVKEVIPAIEESDIIIWLAPNYNDTLAANLAAVINRLTVLYRKIKFYDKQIFGIVVSGNSGSDSVAKQLIGSLNINKGFYLPPNFCIHETANDPNAIYKVDDIKEHAKDFAEHILENL